MTAQEWFDYSSSVSTWTGTIGTGAGLIALIPGPHTPFFAGAAGVLGGISVVSAGVATIAD
ncbi:hypothetical protein AAH978_05840 [Streptomyces sp. ZYX-F-203]